MVNKRKKKIFKNFIVLAVMFLFINLPLVSALEISNIQVTDISDKSVIVIWETDQEADTFLSHGENKESLQTSGDASPVIKHEVPLTELKPATIYYYSVKSGEVVDDNSGDLYSFTTLALDKEAPALKVEIPEIIPGNRLTLSGKSESGSTVNFYINNLLTTSVKAVEGSFTFTGVALANNQESKIKIEAVDSSGNAVAIEGLVFADVSKPKLKLQKLPSLVSSKSIKLVGSISEESYFNILVNNDSIKEGEGIKIDEDVRLEEGKNKIKIILTDKAGWETVEELTISSDTKAPTIKFELAKGKEYYQGRAETDIIGETEPEAKVYLYVHRPLGYEFTPKFDKAWEEVTANDKGEFIFSEINLESPPINLKDLAPQQVPSGLEEERIFATSQVENKPKFTYYVYLIAEDASGKSAHSKTIVNVNTCFSSDFDFNIESIAQFQAPLALNPTLLDDGRETFTAAFNFSYQGKGVSSNNQNPFKIQNVQFETACTQGMLDDEGTALGCNIFPRTPKKTPNADFTAWYLSDNLQTSEKFSDKEEDFWNEFKKRRIVFPLKIKISYQENLGDGKMSELKTQTSCQDLTYLVDIPIDSKDMIPDFLAEEGLGAVEWTIDKIDTILPFLEKAILVVGISWVASFLGRLATRYSRIVTSKLEIFFTKGKPEAERCPANQEKYYMESTIKNWIELQGKAVGNFNTAGLRPDWQDAGKSLDKLCPMTTTLWKTEAVLDQVYRWSGDRFLCRAVPAGWTSTKEKHDVDTVILEQNQCTASSRGVPLREIENCGKLIQENENIARTNQKAAKLIKGGEFTCYQNGNFLYTVNPKTQSSVLNDVGQVIKLELVHDFGLSLQQAELYAGQGDLFAFKPQSSDQFFVAQDKTCKDACKNRVRPGYRAYTDKGISNLDMDGNEGKYGCFREVTDQVSGKAGLQGLNTNDQVTTKQFSAGYTKDCFVDLEKSSTEYQKKNNAVSGANGMLQCVCNLDEEDKNDYVGVRTAMKETADGVTEDWIYRQDQIFIANNRFGTYYPEWRYYSGRDFSSAFGADYLTDYFSEKKHVAKVSPNSQFLGTYQTVCLSRIRAHLVTLKSILEGFRNCITEAKVTGLRDAGVCKTIFTQHVCGLVYKAISVFFQGCSPYGVGDSEKDALGGVGAIGDAVFGSIGEAMQTSIDDVKRDYGNAKLNQYFAAGAQGFTESLCLAAFGYDWPLGSDFILDAAYSVPGESTVLVTPAFRQLSTYNPTTGNAVYNYEIGAMILPGCNVRSYDVSLKCVNQEDLGKPGVQCGKQGCDCLNAQDKSPFEGERIRPLDGGRAFNNLQQNQFFSVPIPSPQKVDSHFRYDHVVVDLKLDPSEKGNEDKCFPDGHEDGRFYYPITDVSPPGVGVCQVQTNGQYFCPEFVKQFGGGQGAYLQEPFLECYDGDIGTWVRCDTPNLYTRGDEIKVRANTVTDGKNYCLRFSTTGLGQGIQPGMIRQLPSGIAGQFKPEFFVDTVRPEMFSGAVTTMVLSGGNKACENQLRFSGPHSGTTSLNFKYQIYGDKYKVFVQDAGVKVENPYTIEGAILKKNGNDILSSVEIKEAQFSYQEFRFSNIIGSPIDGEECSYQIRPAASTQYPANQKNIAVTAELLLAPVSGNCYNANEKVKSGGLGVTSHQQPITIRLEAEVLEIHAKIHADFIRKNYASVISQAESIVNRRVSDLEDAVAIFYLVATHIIQGRETSIGWEVAVGGRDGLVCNLVSLFKTRNNGQLPAYSDQIKESAEYQKIDKYLLEINVAGQCSII